MEMLLRNLHMKYRIKVPLLNLNNNASNLALGIGTTVVLL